MKTSAAREPPAGGGDPGEPQAEAPHYSPPGLPASPAISQVLRSVTAAETRLSPIIAASIPAATWGGCIVNSVRLL